MDKVRVIQDSLRCLQFSLVSVCVMLVIAVAVEMVMIEALPVLGSEIAGVLAVVLASLSLPIYALRLYRRATTEAGSEWNPAQSHARWGARLAIFSLLATISVLGVILAVWIAKQVG